MNKRNLWLCTGLFTAAIAGPADRQVFEQPS